MKDELEGKIRRIIVAGIEHSLGVLAVERIQDVLAVERGIVVVD